MPAYFSLHIGIEHVQRVRTVHRRVAAHPRLPIPWQSVSRSLAHNHPHRIRHIPTCGQLVTHSRHLHLSWTENPQAALVRGRTQQANVDAGRRPGMTTGDAKTIRDLEQEARELKRANEILLAASSFFAGSSSERRAVIGAFIGESRGRFGIEPIC